MNIRFTRSQHLAAKQLRGIAPFIQFALHSFVALNATTLVPAAGTREAATRKQRTGARKGGIDARA